MSAGVVVRDAVAADVKAIVALMNQLALDGAVRETADAAVYDRAFAEIDADPHLFIVVAVAPGQHSDVVVGSISLSMIPNLSHGGRPVATLESAVVDNAHRGKGIGEALVVECVARARAAGCFRVQLTSNNTREDAHRFWKRCGFTHTHAGFKLVF